MNERAAVGLLGLGNMGAAIAHRLVAHFAVVGFDPDDDRRREAAARGVTMVDSVEEVAAAARVVVLSLPRPAISLDATRRLTTVWGTTTVATAPAGTATAGVATSGAATAGTATAGAATAGGTGGAIVETSTVTPNDAKEAAGVCSATGCHYVDAAILSGVGPVTEGRTSLLVGGATASIALVQPVLDAITPTQRHLGDVGAGMAAKVINNAVAHAVYVVLSEAVAMGRANGIELATIVDMFSDPEGGLIRPLTHRIAERVAMGDYDGGMPVDAARKDSELALQLAQSSRIPLFAIQAAHSVY